MNWFVEIRSYNLKPTTRATFHQLVMDQVLPLLKRWQTDLVGYGPSLHDDNSYYLIRAYKSLQEREHDQDAFYSSAEWRQGHREAIVALIESYTTVVIEMNDAALQGLQQDSQLVEIVE
jgi:hypothetical protein